MVGRDNYLHIDSAFELQQHVAADPDQYGEVKAFNIGSQRGGRYMYSISALDLSRLIHGKATTNLEQLHLAVINVTGDFSLFTGALTSLSCRNLKNFTWCLSHPSQTKEEDAAFGQALAQLPQLETFAIYGFITDPQSLEMALPVLQNPNNKLNHFQFGSRQYGNPQVILPHDQLNRYLQASAASTNLVELFLHGMCLGSSQLSAACDLVQHSTSLTHVFLSTARDFDLVSLLGCLKVNKSIKNIEIDGPGRSCKEIINALKENKAAYKSEAKMLLDVLLQHNYNLEFVNIYPWIVHSWCTIPYDPQQQTSQRAWEKANRLYLCLFKMPNHDDFHHILAGIFLSLRLNKEGRGHLLAPSSSSSKPLPQINDCIINCIAANKDDVPVIFYFLQPAVSSLF